MRMWHVAVFVICLNFAFGIVGGLGIFKGVPTTETIQYANYSKAMGATMAGLVLAGGIAAGAARLMGYAIPGGVFIFITVFGVSTIPLSGWLSKLAQLPSWPGQLNVAILGIVGFIYVYTIIQLASVGGKQVD